MADRYGVVVLKQKMSLGTCQRRSRKCVPCSAKRRPIRCTVTGSRCHPSDLPLHHYYTYVPVLNIRQKMFRCKIIFA